jgi:2-methylisocitrate lyase-like PEP mutase family enzyme
MFRAFAERMPGVPLLANMTEFGKTPFFTAAEFEAMGYAMVIWPVSSLRMANKAQAELYAAISRDGGPRSSSGCRRAQSSTRQSACMTTKRWILPSFKQSFQPACPNTNEHASDAGGH